MVFGTSMTGIAAQLLGNELGMNIPTILLNLSPYTFIASNYNNLIIIILLKKLMNALKEASSAYGVNILQTLYKWYSTNEY